MRPLFFLRSPGILSLAAATLLSAGAPGLLHAQDGRGRKYKAPPPVSTIKVTVLRASNGKPVENAAVIFHTVHEGKDQGNMELKTDEDGEATITVIPVGDLVQLQIFKAGFKTFGEDFTNDQVSREVTVRVKPPMGQYSIYQKAPVDANQQQSVTPQPTQGADKPSPTNPQG